MILFTVIIILVSIITTIISLAVGTTSVILMVVFGDAMVCMFIIYTIIKNIIKRLSQRWLFLFYF